MGAKEETGKIEYHYGFYGAVHVEYEPTHVEMEYLQEAGIMPEAVKRIFKEEIEKEREEERLDNIRNMMQSFHMSAEQVMDGMKIPKEEQARYAVLM